jgi:hypothetical protein
MFHPSTQAVFVFGHHRSGTNLLFQLLRDSLDAQAYNEDNSDAFQNFRLRDSYSIGALIREASPRPCLFKPISETITFIEVLGCYPDARGIFIFRDPLDVVASSLREFGPGMHSLNHDIAYNFIQNRLRDLRISIADWEPIDRIIERYRGRFSLSGDFASKFALNWLLMHAALLERGIILHPKMTLVAYEDLVAAPAKISNQLSEYLQIDLVLPPVPPQIFERTFFTDKIDVQLVRDCAEIFRVYQDASRR